MYPCGSCSRFWNKPSCLCIVYSVNFKCTVQIKFTWKCYAKQAYYCCFQVKQNMIEQTHSIPFENIEIARPALQFSCYTLIMFGLKWMNMRRLYCIFFIFSLKLCNACARCALLDRFFKNMNSSEHEGKRVTHALCNSRVLNNLVPFVWMHPYFKWCIQTKSTKLFNTPKYEYQEKKVHLILKCLQCRAKTKELSFPFQYFQKPCM